MDGQMQNSAAGYGCFLIIPLKYDKDSFEKAKLEQVGESIPVTTMDLNENVKAMFSPEDEMAAGTGYAIPRDPLTAKITEYSIEKAIVKCGYPSEEKCSYHWNKKAGGLSVRLPERISARLFELDYEE